MAEKEKEEQARKAHALAEKCFLAGNVAAARQWMQSAVRLAPDLPGTPQIVAAYDVHAAAAKSSRNWYAVLGLKPGRALTHDDIKKSHRRLCLLVHPDKNPSAAADGAFKLIHAAWEALSAKHPPLATAVPAAPANKPAPPPPPPSPPPPPQRRAAPPRPPPPPPQQQRRTAPPRPREPQPRPRPRPRRPAPQTTARSAAPTPPTHSQQAKPKQEGECPRCGAQSFNGRNNHRCMSCRWSSMDGRPKPRDEDGPYYEDDYYDDDDFYDYFTS